MESAAQLMNGEYGTGEDDDAEALLDLVLHAETSFQDSCVSFCERANSCFERALEAGRGVVLGDDTDRFLNGISLHRADELLGGSKPLTAAEDDFMRRMTLPLPELP